MQISALSIDEQFDALSEWVRTEFAKIEKRYMEPPPVVIDSVKVKAMWDFALTRTQGEYAELCETWKNTDTKAQATIAAAGALVAVIATLVRRTPARFSRESQLRCSSQFCFSDCPLGCACGQCGRATS